MKRMRRNPCERTQASFSGYLDGAISGREMQTVAAHLERCPLCANDFAAWRSLQQMLCAAGAVKAPEDLGLRLRLAISHEKSRSQGVRVNLAARWENLIRPMLLHTVSGVASALLLVGGIATLSMVAVPSAVLANDEPLGAVTMPHFLYSAARQQPIVTPGDSTVVVQAEINSEGRVYDWKIISGPTDQTTQSEVRDQLMLQVYEPARMFGQPVRGQVLVTFAGVLVRG